MSKPTLFEALKTTLNNWYPDDPITHTLPYDTPPKQLTAPVYSLLDNPALLLALFDNAAISSGRIDSRSQFTNRLSMPRSLPREPSIDEPRFAPPVRYKTVDERKIARSILYHRALKAHKATVAELQTRIDETDRIAAIYPRGDEGYLEYARDKLRSFEPLIADKFLAELRPLKISLIARQRHSFVCGGTGSGKSEAAKSLIRNYLTDPEENDCCIIVLDPHGQLAWEVARMSDIALSNRLVYIDPTTGPLTGQQITFNPFQLSDRSEAAIDQQIQQLIDAFLQVISKPTEAMENLLLHVITALLYRGGSDLSHFIQFMTDDVHPDTGNPVNEALRLEAMENLPLASHRDFFRYGFRSQTLNPTKAGLAARFNGLTSQPPVQRFLCGQSSFDFETAIDQKKIIIANLQASAIGRKATSLLGQFLSAYINSYAARRSAPGSIKPKHPIHLFADECQYFVSPQTSQILEEARKNNFDITLITQSTHQIKPASILASLFTNAGMMLVGTNQGITVSAMESNTGIPGSTIRNLAAGQFVLKETKTPGQKLKPARQITMPLIEDLHDIAHSHGEAAWRDVLAKNMANYYRPIDQQTVSPLKHADDAPIVPELSQARPLPSDDDFLAAIKDNQPEPDNRNS